MVVRYPQSYHKTLKQIGCVAKSSFIVDGRVYTPPNEIRLSPTFYRQYHCPLGCGGCCFAFTLDYLPSEYKTAIQKYPFLEREMEEICLTIDGNQRTLLSIPPLNRQRKGNRVWCDYLDLDTGACTIHQHNPFSCRIELIKFWWRGAYSYLMKRSYGRAWAMTNVVTGDKGVLCDFSEFDETQFYDNDVPVLVQMIAWADYLGIETHLPTILEALKSAVLQRHLRPFAIRNKQE